MRVRCASIPGWDSENRPESSPWLTVGAEYLVLDILARPVGRTDLHIITDVRGEFGLFPSSSFVSVDDRIPASWVARIDEHGVLRLGPPEWLRPGFWESYYDGDREITAIVDAAIEDLAEY